MKWQVREYMGHEVTSLSGDILTGSIYPGTGVLLWDSIRGYVVEIEHDLYVDTGSTLWFLEYKKDDRQCWVSTGAMNKKCLGLNFA